MLVLNAKCSSRELHFASVYGTRFQPTIATFFTLDDSSIALRENEIRFSLCNGIRI